MLKQPVYINSIASISALGTTATEIWANYLHDNSLFQKLEATKKNIGFLNFQIKKLLF